MISLSGAMGNGYTMVIRSGVMVIIIIIMVIIMMVFIIKVLAAIIIIIIIIIKVIIINSDGCRDKFSASQYWKDCVKYKVGHYQITPIILVFGN